jgi:hypothetical protein
MAKRTIGQAIDELLEEAVSFEGQDMSGHDAMARLLRRIMLSSKEPTNIRLQAINMILDKMDVYKKKNAFEN